MKSSAKEAMSMHDFGRAITSFIQIDNVLNNVRTIRKDENDFIESELLEAALHLTEMSLKNWEWTRARRACDKVLRKLFYMRRVLTVTKTIFISSFNLFILILFIFVCTRSYHYPTLRAQQQ
jgi:hypothetical protein